MKIYPKNSNPDIYQRWRKWLRHLVWWSKSLFPSVLLH